VVRVRGFVVRLGGEGAVGVGVVRPVDVPPSSCPYFKA
jgi:hypothetical protein